MAEEKPGGAAPAARKQWDKSEWEAKAKAKDAEYAERAKEAEAAMQSGKRPQFKPKDDLPKPTKALEQRKEDLGIEKNLNKTMLVQTTATGKGHRGAGFYCELCNRTLKDSLSYLDHVNGKDHLRQLGQTIHVSRSTVSQVRARIAQLRAETATKVTAKNFDFQARLSDIRKNSNDEKVRRKEEKKRKRLERKEEEEMARMGVIKKSKVDADEPAPEATSRDKGRDKKKRVEKEDRENEEESKQVEQAQQQYQDMAAMMGFGGFSAKKK